MCVRIGGKPGVIGTEWLDAASVNQDGCEDRPRRRIRFVVVKRRYSFEFDNDWGRYEAGPGKQGFAQRFALRFVANDGHQG